MSIEQGPFSQGAGNEQPKDQEALNIEQAWIGALAEKPVRDLAREEGASEEEKAILDRLAERHGEKAVQEYGAEKEKNPIERLLARVDKIAVEMEGKGLGQDAAMVKKIKDRFDLYAETVRKGKEGLEESRGRRVSLQELKRSGHSEYAIGDSIPVTHQIGRGGGWTYSPQGFARSWFSEGDLEKYKDSFEKERTEHNMEVVNFSFSKEGETEFYRSLGVLGANEEVIDIPTIYQRADNEERKKRGHSEGHIDPKNYQAKFPTNIDGVILEVKKDRSRSYDGQGEERISLGFDDKFLEAILAKK
ncbi:MAG: hypothetical protein V1696_01470 [Candidatus Jorgensenbacteria bacterium]